MSSDEGESGLGDTALLDDPSGLGADTINMMTQHALEAYTEPPPTKTVRFTLPSEKEQVLHGENDLGTHSTPGPPAPPYPPEASNLQSAGSMGGPGEKSMLLALPTTTTTTSTLYSIWLQLPEVYTASMGDMWPNHWGTKRISDANRYYRSMPEEFYSDTKLPVVTPSNCQQWIHGLKKLGLTVEMQEFCSGSSRLSLAGYKEGLRVGFPVDHRYGWDIGVPEHQVLLDEVDSVLGVTIDFFSPRCSPWSKANTTSKAETKARARLEERPGLLWIAQRCRKTFATKYPKEKAFVLETPHGSQLLTAPESPYAVIYNDARSTSGILDQCQHGAKHQSSDLPIRKPPS